MPHKKTTVFCAIVSVPLILYRYKLIFCMELIVYDVSVACAGINNYVPTVPSPSFIPVNSTWSQDSILRSLSIRHPKTSHGGCDQHLQSSQAAPFRDRVRCLREGYDGNLRCEHRIRDSSLPPDKYRSSVYSTCQLMRAHHRLAALSSFVSARDGHGLWIEILTSPIVKVCPFGHCD